MTQADGLSKRAGVLCQKLTSTVTMHIKFLTQGNYLKNVPLGAWTCDLLVIILNQALWLLNQGMIYNPQQQLYTTCFCLRFQILHLRQGYWPWISYRTYGDMFSLFWLIENMLIWLSFLFLHMTARGEIDTLI